MKISANDIRAGNVLEHNGKLYVVSKTPEHTKPGKGGAFVQVEMSEMSTGTKIYERFRSTETVERARLEEFDYQYLYLEGDKVVVMNQETFEQLELPKFLLEDRIAMLQEGMVLKVNFYQERPLSITLPDTIICTVEEAEPVIKGQTATSSYKPAVLDNGLKVMVPPFIDTGTKIVIRTEDCTYVERAK